MNEGRHVVEFVKELARAEWLTPPGFINVVGVFTTFLVVAGAGLVDFAEWSIRQFETHPKPSNVPFMTLFLVHIGWLALCVLMISFVFGLTPRRRRQ